MEVERLGKDRDPLFSMNGDGSLFRASFHTDIESAKGSP